MRRRVRFASQPPGAGDEPRPASDRASIDVAKFHAAPRLWQPHPGDTMADALTPLVRLLRALLHHHRRTATAARPVVAATPSTMRARSPNRISSHASWMHCATPY